MTMFLSFFVPNRLSNLNAFIWFVLSLMLPIAGYTQLSGIHDVPLLLIDEFPDEESDVFIGYINNITSDNNGHIFVNDWRTSTIFKFSTDGRLVNEISKEGRGPGEFFNQNYTVVSDDKLYISDSGNTRIMITDLDGNEINTFMKGTHPLIFYDVKDGLMYGYTSYARVHPDETPNLNLIHIFNSEGKIIKQFGTLLNMVTNMSPNASQPIIRIFEDQLFVLFRFYPILRVYTLEGELLNEFKFDNLQLERLVPGNYSPSSFSSSGMNTRFLFKGLNINEHGIFILQHDSPVTILHLDHDLKLIQRFRTYTGMEISNALDMLVFDDPDNPDQLLFYVALGREDPHRIARFSAQFRQTR